MENKHNIITYGLTAEQNGVVRRELPNKNYEIIECDDCATDLIAVPATTLIINAEKLSQDNLKMIMDYYAEVGDYADETVIWLGNPKPSAALQKTIKVYDNFDSMGENIKGLLLEVAGNAG